MLSVLVEGISTFVFLWLSVLAGALWQASFYPATGINLGVLHFFVFLVGARWWTAIRATDFGPWPMAVMLVWGTLITFFIKVNFS